MDRAEFLERITVLEQRLQRAELDESLITFWPLIRMRIRELSTADIKFKPWQKLPRVLTLLASLLRGPTRLQKCQVIIFTSESDFEPKKGICRTNRTKKAWMKLFDPNLKLSFLTSATTGIVQTFRGGDALSVTRDIFFARAQSLFQTRFKTSQIGSCSMSENVKEVFGFELDYGFDLRLVENLATRFERYLLKSEPDLVVMSVWYSREAMAMTLACKRLSIRTVDYQHGAQNDIHPMYTNWNLRAEDFDLMPEIFWTWGEISMKRINKWAKQYKNHRAILGGNLKANYWQKENKSSSSLVGTGQNNKPLIYFTLQGDDAFNEEILTVLEETQNQMNWVFRDHPRQPISSPLKRKIMSASGRKARIVRNTSLYEDLQKSSVHITGFSTCAFEAEIFGVPTIFTHESASLGQPEVLETNGFLFCFTREEIVAGLDKLLQSEPPKSNYIDRNVDSNLVLSRIMKGEL